MIGLNTVITLLIAVYIAFSIGANDETMMVVASGSSFMIRRLALVGGIVTCIGAIIYGQLVEETIGKGILTILVTSRVGLIILIATASWLTVVSYFGWPVSTSHSTVGAVIGYGIFAGSLNWQNLNKILLSWLISPIAGFVFSYLIIRLFDKIEIGQTNNEENERSKNWLYALIVGALLQEFWQGANNVSNATSFLSATFDYPIISRTLGGVFLAVGLFILGVRVLGIAGRRITRLPIHAAFGTQLIIVFLNIVGTLYGIPLSGTHISIACLIGAGLACKTKIDYSIVKKVFLYWFLTLPGAALFTMAAAYISTFIFV